MIPGSYYGGLWSEWWLPGLLWKVWTWDRNYQGQVRLKDRYIGKLIGISWCRALHSNIFQLPPGLGHLSELPSLHGMTGIL